VQDAGRWRERAMKSVLIAVCGFVLICVSCPRLRAESPDKAWLEQWKQQNRQWRAIHLIGPRAEKLGLTKQFVAEVLAPKGFNVLILEVNYGFQFTSHPELECRGITREQARDLAAFCRRHNVRLIPLFNCLGHQSWAGNTFALLKKYPQFDETPHVPPDNKGIYCREWCPSHPEVNQVVFDLLDELIEAFEADAIHVGMDEVFLIGDEKCPRCRGKDVAELFGKTVGELHEHLVRQKGVEMLMWGDRLLDASALPYSKWDASSTGSHRAIDRIPKDIIMCDWHYGRKDAYPSVQLFQEKGLRVLPATWKTPEAAVALIRASRQNATDKMLGILFTGWSAGGNGEHLMAALRPEGDDPSKIPQTAREVAATIKAGLQELSAAKE
jgi:hypothetical protein